MDAERAMKRLEIDKEIRGLNIYSCPFCSGWHWGIGESNMTDINPVQDRRDPISNLADMMTAFHAEGQWF